MGHRVETCKCHIHKIASTYQVKCLEKLFVEDEMNSKQTDWKVSQALRGSSLQEASLSAQDKKIQSTATGAIDARCNHSQQSTHNRKHFRMVSMASFSFKSRLKL